MSRMTIFTAPGTRYTSIKDVGKFNMLWHVSLGLAFVFTILFAIHIAFRDDNWATSLAAFGVAVINLLVLYQTRKYRFVGILSIVLGIFICQASIYIVEDSHVVSDAMWCILVAFFTFFLFGSLYGTIVLMLNLGCLVGYLVYADPSSLASKGLTGAQVDVRMVVNVLYVAMALAYVIYKMIQNNDEMIGRYEAQTKQNEILLKEVHHRVKNNLQIVSSLLRLQAAENSNEKVIGQFEEAIGRIRSMALIHEKMYVNEDFSSIDVDSYIQSLVKDISNSIHTECEVELKLSTEVRQIDIKSVVPLSLLLNELITNSIRHGFDQMQRAAIEISLEEAGDKVLLYYSDSGVWKEGAQSGFGLELINTLTEQLHGTFERTAENGTHYRFVLDADEFFFRSEEEA